jgi:DNA repair protein SbcC/Rad50
MLKSLYIKNFQSHKDTEIDLSSFVTAIVGLNNHGKSAVLRAFQKVIRNEPDGTTFIRDGEKQCEITLLTDSGKVCRSVKNDNSADANKYTINDKDKFVKFDRDIPTEVLALLDTSPPQLFGDIEVDFNFQPQLDQLFLVQGDGLPSKRGKILGSVTGVDVVNRAIQLCASAMKTSKSEMIRTEQSVVDVNNKLLGYADIDILCSRMNDLLADGIMCKNLSDKIESYRNILSSLESLVEKASKATTIVEAIDLEKVNTLVEEATSLQKRIGICKQLLALQGRRQKLQSNVDIPLPEDISSIQKLVRQINVIKSIQYLEKTLNKASQVIIQTQVIEEIAVRKEEIQQTQETLQTYRNLESLLSSLQIKIQKGKETLTASDKELMVATEAKRVFEKELGVCPTCNRPFSKRYWWYHPESNCYVLLSKDVMSDGGDSGLLEEICSEDEATTEKESQFIHKNIK